jgi:hypothetical protein
MKMPVYRPRSRPSRFERLARKVAIVLAAILLGFTAIEVAVVSKRTASVPKLPTPSTTIADHSQ